MTTLAVATLVVSVLSVISTVVLHLRVKSGCCDCVVEPVDPPATITTTPQLPASSVPVTKS
jgi:hypothetical protein